MDHEDHNYEREFESLRKALDLQIVSVEDKIISKIKIWLMTSLITMLVAFIVGSGFTVFTIGRFTANLEAQMTQVTAMQSSRKNLDAWVDRKDALDDDMIRWAQSKGYHPPTWYKGKDADSTGK